MASTERDQSVRRFRSAATLALTRRERSEVAAILSRFKRSNSVVDLTDSLLAVLDTPAKLELVPLLRGLLPVSFRAEYDRRTRYGYNDDDFTEKQFR